jgi:DNA-binding MarR family transcriptional regulator
MVPLSRQDIQDAARLLRLLTEAPEAIFLQPSSAVEPGHIVPRETLLKLARKELRDRRRRSQLFDDSIFGEPGWEILVHLYIEQQGARFHIGRLAKHLRVPESTTLRWVKFLHEQGLIHRNAHPTDLRLSVLDLTTEAINALDLYFSETLKQTA